MLLYYKLLYAYALQVDYIIRNVYFFMNNNNRKESRLCTRKEYMKFIQTPRYYAYPGLGW